jgi:hypothetical protein
MKLPAMLAGTTAGLLLAIAQSPSTPPPPPSAQPASAAIGNLGHVEDFLIDDETWAIRYSIVDTRNWLPGRKVLVSPEWIQRVSWEESKVYVDLSKRHIEAAPEFDPSIGRAKYWEREPRAPEGKTHGKT